MVDIIYQCLKCGRIHQDTVDGLCCGVPMRPGKWEGGKVVFFPQVDVVYIGPKVGFIDVRPAKRGYWVEWYELWVLKPKEGEKIQIGWFGKRLGGIWEYEMVPGVQPSEGIAMCQVDIVEAMMSNYGVV